MTPPGYREGPAVAYVPCVTSLADYQRNPRVPFPLGYRRCEVEGAEKVVYTELRYEEK
ncbi:MAG: hypothetical protein WC114_11025 [Smithellaceae bacterium]|jgi:hypothetical protein